MANFQIKGHPLNAPLSNDVNDVVVDERNKLVDEIAAICFRWPEHEIVTFLAKLQEVTHSILLSKLDEANARYSYMTTVMDDLRELLPGQEVPGPINQ